MKQITVQVIGDFAKEADEDFFVNLSNPVNLVLNASQAKGVILNDDPKGEGYWLVASDGGIFSFGDAAFYGSTGHIKLNQPIVGMAADARPATATGWSPPTAASSPSATPPSTARPAPSRSTSRSSAWPPTPTGNGYWLVASDGGIFAFGDAGFYGSTGAMALNRPIVGMAATATGHGYWLVASDGGIFTFGDAAFYGSTGGQPLEPARSSAWPPRPTGTATGSSRRDGGIFSFGDAGFYGSTGAHPASTSRSSAWPRPPTGNGYWLVASDGGIFSFGDAGFYGSTGAIKLNQPINGMGALPHSLN